VCFISFAREASGAAAPGVPHALYFEASGFAKLGRIAPRDRGLAFENAHLEIFLAV
jgi:hypothetical protein